MIILEQWIVAIDDMGGNEFSCTLPAETELVQATVLGATTAPMDPDADAWNDQRAGTIYTFPATPGQEITAKLGGRPTSGDLFAASWEDYIAGFLLIGGLNGGGAGGGPPVTIVASPAPSNPELDYLVGTFAVSGGAGETELRLDGQLLIVEPGEGGAGTYLHFNGSGYSGGFGAASDAINITGIIPDIDQPPRYPLPGDHLGATGGLHTGADGTTFTLTTDVGDFVVPTGGGGGGWGGGASGSASHARLGLDDQWSAGGGRTGGRHWAAPAAPLVVDELGQPIPVLVNRTSPEFDAERPWRWGCGLINLLALKPDVDEQPDWLVGRSRLT